MTDARERFDRRQARGPASPPIEALAAQAAGRTLFGRPKPGSLSPAVDAPRMLGSARRPPGPQSVDGKDAPRRSPMHSRHTLHTHDPIQSGVQAPSDPSTVHAVHPDSSAAVDHYAGYHHPIADDAHLHQPAPKQGTASTAGHGQSPSAQLKHDQTHYQHHHHHQHEDEEDDQAARDLPPEGPAVPRMFGGAGVAAEVAAEQAAEKEAQQEKQLHHGGNFGNYMSLKITKLREQFEANQYHAPARSGIFRGVAIHVNGYTNPTHAELKQLMALHGGRFENYLQRGAVTHIICNHLPDTKIKQLATARDPLPIVRPEWITASIAAGRLLPASDFLLLAPAGAGMRTSAGMGGSIGPGRQRLLSAFTPHAAPAPAPQELYPQLLALPAQEAAHAQDAAHVQAAAAIQDGSHAHGASVVQEVSPGKEACSAQRAAAAEAAALSVQEGSFLQAGLPATGAAAAQQQDAHAHAHAQDVPPPRHPHMLHTALPGQAAGTSAVQEQHQKPLPPHPQGSHSYHPSNDSIRPMGHDPHAAAREVAAGMRAACEVLKGPPKSTKDDPRFMESFFKASRLHFIGTWKSRIETLMEQVAADPSARGPDPRPMPGASSVQPAGNSGSSMFNALRGGVHSNAAAGGSAQGGGIERAIIHIDMDCFFASVAMAGRPQLVGAPLAVCHSDSKKGSGEVSCPNYEARTFGVSAGMFIAHAKSLCPDLVVVPYEFERYQTVSEQVYCILLRYSSVVQALSCDEAYVDVTGLGDPEKIAADIRRDIESATACCASAGIGPSLLVSRLATRKAKPNGQLRVRKQGVQDFLADLPVDALPGVGWSVANKLKTALNITMVRQVWASSKAALQRSLGDKSGAQLWAYAFGHDMRVVELPKARKSVGAEVNYGIRFDGPEEARSFLQDLSREVATRMHEAGVRGRLITLKLKVRQEGAPVPAKFLGHGPCDNVSRSVTLGSFINSPQDIFREAWSLLCALNVPAQELRGVGLAVARLDNDPASKTARPSAAPPSKVPAPPRSVYDPARFSHFPPLPNYIAPAGDPSTSTAAAPEAGRPGSGSPDAARMASPGSSKTHWPSPGSAALSRMASARGPAAVGDIPDTEGTQPNDALRMRGEGVEGDTGAAAGKEVQIHPAALAHEDAGAAAHQAGAALPDADILHAVAEQLTLRQGFLKLLGVESVGAQHVTEDADKQQQQQQQQQQADPESGDAALVLYSSDDDASEGQGGVSHGAVPGLPALKPQSRIVPRLPSAAAVASAGPFRHEHQHLGHGPSSSQHSMQSLYSMDAYPHGAQGGSGQVASSRAARMKQQRQQRQSSHSPAAGRAYGGGMGPVSAAELDPQVLEALPPDVRREVEAAYGLASRPWSTAHANAARKRGPNTAPGYTAAAGGGMPAARVTAHATTTTRPPLAKRARRDLHAPLIASHAGSTAGLLHGGSAHPHAHHANVHAPLSMAQIDPDVWAALPPELQLELSSSLRPMGRPDPRIMRHHDVIMHGGPLPQGHHQGHNRQATHAPGMQQHAEESDMADIADAEMADAWEDGRGLHADAGMNVAYGVAQHEHIRQPGSGAVEMGGEDTASVLGSADSADVQLLQEIPAAALQNAHAHAGRPLGSRAGAAAGSIGPGWVVNAACMEAMRMELAASRILDGCGPGGSMDRSNSSGDGVVEQHAAMHRVLVRFWACARELMKQMPVPVQPAAGQVQLPDDVPPGAGQVQLPGDVPPAAAGTSAEAPKQQVAAAAAEARRDAARSAELPLEDAPVHVHVHRATVAEVSKPPPLTPTRTAHSPQLPHPEVESQELGSAHTAAAAQPAVDTERPTAAADVAGPVTAAEAVCVPAAAANATAACTLVSTHPATELVVAAMHPASHMHATADIAHAHACTVAPRLHAACQWLVLWLIGQSGDLEVLAGALRRLKDWAGQSRWAGAFAAHAARVQARVLAHVQHKYGVLLQL